MNKFVVLAVLAIAVVAGPVQAQEPVKVGILFPLTGNAASAGQAAKAAVELGAEIVNGAHPELAPLPLAATAGLPNLKGAKIEIVAADNQGNPSVGQSQALRLINDEHVSALVGAYQSSVTLAATAVAERYGTPWVVGDSVAANITGRGFKWTFRVTPIASDFATNYMQFLGDLGKAGHPIKTIAIVYENTDYGTSVAGSLRDSAKAANLPIVADVSYNANSTDVSAQVLQLKDKNPDAVIFVSYTADTILYMRTMKNLNYRPKVIIGDDSGFSDPAFIENVGTIAQGAVNRSAWDVGKPGSVTEKINAMFKAKTGHDLDDTSARNMQAFFVLADAINRAGSTKPEAIQAALKATDLKADHLMMGYRGVKFDETGQNTLAATYLIQLQGKDYVAVWPEKSAVAKLVYPYKGWE
ncbi:MAG TPA: ABC transporter substrate-binding protein [Alphaproteobacteria bacterium]|nr:ABC transporter substrate-binding protein [Alphaproteobacteria bacterium]